MNTNDKPADMNNVKVRLSTLWIFAILNYLYADVLGLYDPAILNDLMTGSVGGVQLTDGFMLGAAILMETAIVMVLLSRVLPYSANRWANMIAGVIHTTAVFASMFLGSPPALYYLFFGSIEIATTLYIIWYAWKWPNPEKSVNSLPLGKVEFGSKS
jgi:hypothetical protein